MPLWFKDILIGCLLLFPGGLLALLTTYFLARLFGWLLGKLLKKPSK